MNTDPFLVPFSAEVRKDVESEAALVQRVHNQVNTCNWVIGECGSIWKEQWAKGRSDEDFAAMVGMKGDQIYQRRRVWERFGATHHQWPSLSWSHFYAALTWEDAEAALQYAYERKASVSEMKLWRESAGGTCPPEREIRTYDEDSDIYRKLGEDGENREVYGSDAGGKDNGQETGGKDSHQERPPKATRSVTEVPEGDKPQKDPFRLQKALAVKTAEALMRAIDDLNDMKPVPKHDTINDYLCEAIEAVRACK